MAKKAPDTYEDARIEADPLVEVAKYLSFYNTSVQDWADELRAALEARGLEITEKGQ